MFAQCLWIYIWLNLHQVKCIKHFILKWDAKFLALIFYYLHFLFSKLAVEMHHYLLLLRNLMRVQRSIYVRFTYLSTLLMLLRNRSLLILRTTAAFRGYWVLVIVLILEPRIDLINTWHLSWLFWIKITLFHFLLLCFKDLFRPSVLEGKYWFLAIIYRFCGLMLK